MKVGLNISLMIFLLPQFQLVKSFYDSSLWQAVSKMIQNVAVLANKFMVLWLRKISVLISYWLGLFFINLLGEYFSSFRRVRVIARLGVCLHYKKFFRSVPNSLDKCPHPAQPNLTFTQIFQATLSFGTKNS